jgi:hypothetical protein
MSTRDVSGYEETARNLMMAALDGEITPSEQQELNQLLDDAPGLRLEWERLEKVKEVTRSMMYRDPPDEVWEDYWVSVYNRCERGVGWLLVTVFSVVLLSWGAWEILAAMFEDNSLPWFLKLSVMGVAVGGIILFVSVAREKWFVRKTDPYKEVIR